MLNYMKCNFKSLRYNEIAIYPAAFPSTYIENIGIEIGI